MTTHDAKIKLARETKMSKKKKPEARNFFRSITETIFIVLKSI